MELSGVLMELSRANGVSGQEDGAVAAAKRFLEPLVDRTEVTPLGNLIGYRASNKAGAKTVLLDAHLDQVGLVVTGQKNGLLTFTGGVGDAVALWAPLTYEAEAKGFKSVANSKDCGITQLVLLVANRRFADQHPEQVQAFLKMYMRGIEALRAKPAKELAVDYVRFYKEWTGRDLTPEMAVADIQSHPVFTLDEQLAMLAPGGSVQKALNEIVDFSISHGSFTPEQIDKMKGKTQVAARFLEAIK